MAVLYPTSDLPILDLTNPRNLGLRGLTSEIQATLDYRRSQSVATETMSESLAGILYNARHDLSSSLVSCVLLSGKSHLEEVVEESSLMVEETLEIPSYVIAEAADRFAITVTPDAPLVFEDVEFHRHVTTWDLPDEPYGGAR